MLASGLSARWTDADLANAAIERIVRVAAEYSRQQGDGAIRLARASDELVLKEASLLLQAEVQACRSDPNPTRNAERFAEFACRFARAWPAAGALTLHLTVLLAATSPFAIGAALSPAVLQLRAH